jgi:[ribosomal protein S18]-alanine N-acetyltransferase
VQYLYAMIRSYLLSDRQDLINVFQSNVPDYFAQSELIDLIEHLDQKESDYYVIVQNNEIVGGGGIALEEDDTVSICWGMVRRDYHKKGMGKLLLEFRLRKIQEHFPGKKICVRTSQHTEAFFHKFGFRTIYSEKNYWAEGLDLFTMIKEQNA